MVPAVTVVLLATAARRAPTVERATPPRLLFNCDGCSCTISNFAPPITLDQLCRPVNELANTQVDVFIHCVNLGGDAYNYPSKVGELFGRSITDWSGVHPRLKIQAANLKSLVEAGHDPVTVLEKRTHELGMRFWLSMRMNEQHEDDVKRFGAKITPFKKQNRHLLIGPDFRPGTMAYADKYGYTYSWNYAEEGTREHLLAVLDEMLQRYFVDGLELDYGRGACYFKQGEEADGMPVMTEFVRSARGKVDRFARAKQHQITLAVRVPPGFQRCGRLGLDVRTWITEGLVDLVIPMDPGYLDMQPNLSEFIDAARVSQVSIAGGLEQNTAGYGKNVSQLYAAVSAFRHQGAKTVYLFNFDCHRQKGRANRYTAEEIRFLKNVADYKTVAKEDKHYFITRDGLNRTPRQGGLMQLPQELCPGEMRAFHLHIGDDPEAAQRAGTLASGTLRITLKGYDPQQVSLAVWVNDQALKTHNAAVQNDTLSFGNPPLHNGPNTVSLRINREGSASRDPVRVEKIEYFLDYR
jgi:hypothetical protein